jgi:hypothetical protein
MIAGSRRATVQVEPIDIDRDDAADKQERQVPGDHVTIGRATALPLPRDLQSR